VNATNATHVGTNLTSLDDPYIEVSLPIWSMLRLTSFKYISAIPNFSMALTKLGRAWHSEMNRPVSEAIDSMQQAMTVRIGRCSRDKTADTGALGSSNVSSHRAIDPHQLDAPDNSGIELSRRCSGSLE
jgi:hypothetical protein